MPLSWEGHPGLPRDGKGRAAALRRASWETAAWAGVRSASRESFGKGVSVSVEATASVGWALLPPLAFGGSSHLAGSLRVSWGLGVQAPSPSHSCFPLYSWDPLPD